MVDYVIKDAEDLARFMAKVNVDADSGCWLWAGAIASTGYAMFRLRGGARLAHRVSFETHRGTPPPGLHLDHLCRVRHCVNPAHLEPVTSSENLRRGAGGYGSRSLCRAGIHDITRPENVKVRANGRRQCKECVNAASRARRAAA